MSFEIEFPIILSNNITSINQVIELPIDKLKSATCKFDYPVPMIPLEYLLMRPYDDVKEYIGRDFEISDPELVELSSRLMNRLDKLPLSSEEKRGYLKKMCNGYGVDYRICIALARRWDSGYKVATAKFLSKVRKFVNKYIIFYFIIGAHITLLLPLFSFTLIPFGLLATLDTITPFLSTYNVLSMTYDLEHPITVHGKRAAGIKREYPLTVEEAVNSDNKLAGYVMKMTVNPDSIILVPFKRYLDSVN